MELVPRTDFRLPAGLGWNSGRSISLCMCLHMLMTSQIIIIFRSTKPFRDQNNSQEKASDNADSGFYIPLPFDLASDVMRVP